MKYFLLILLFLFTNCRYSATTNNIPLLRVLMALMETGTGAEKKDLTAFSFPAQSATGTITGTSISVTVPVGTSVTALVATFTTTGASVKVGTTVQVSGTTANDFTSPVTYTVTAGDGTTQDYVVTVSVAAGAVTSITFSPVESNRTWSAISMSENGQYQVASYADGIYFSNDFGNTWTSKVNYPGAYNIRLSSVSSDGKYSLVASYAKPSYLSNDFGATWSTPSTGCGVNHAGAMSTDGKYQIITKMIYNCGQSFSFSTNYGVTWTDVNTGYFSSGLRGVAIAGLGQIQLITTGGYQYLYSSNYGASWTTYSLSDNSLVIGNTSISDSGQYILLGGFPGTGIYLSTTGGNNPNNFSQILASEGTTLSWSISMSATGQRMVAIQQNKVFFSNDFGSTWLSVNFTGSSVGNSIAISRDGIHITVAPSGGQLYTATLPP